MTLASSTNGKWPWLVTGVLTIIVIVVYISVRQSPDAGTHVPIAVKPHSPEDDSRSATGSDSIGSDQSVAVSSEPLSDLEVSDQRSRIARLSQDYPARITARRALLTQLRERGPGELVQSELIALVDDVKAREGVAMAQRVAFSEAGTWKAEKDHTAAIVAFRLVMDQYPTGPFAAEALYHLGDCHMELHQYGEAEALFQRFVEEHHDSPQSGWGWRKLALSQLLQSEFDRSLATLELMAAHFGDGEFAEYARARKGYVQKVAGRLTDAKASYEAFLNICPKSKYCRLVQKQRAELDGQSLSVGM